MNKTKQQFTSLVFFCFFISLSLTAQVTFPQNGVYDDRDGLYAFTNATIYKTYNEKIENAILIIKKWKVGDGGRGGSVALCDAIVGDEFRAVWPAGHFILQENTDNKLFLGTGTGLVPLFNQIIEGLRKKSWEKYQLVFWVRHMSDMFYVEEFEALKQKYPDNFYYHLVVSRDDAEGIIKKWYVTDFLSQSVASQYQEYYICWAPAMIEGCQKRLTQLWVLDEKVYFEKYA